MYGGLQRAVPQTDEVLVESDSTVVVSVMNKGHHLITLGVKKALVALDEAQCISDPMTTQNYELEDAEEEEGEPDKEETRELPDYLRELYQLAVAKIEDPREGHLIKRLLVDYQDIFLKPGDTLQVAKVGEQRIETGDAAPVKQRPYRMSEEAHRIMKCKCDDMLKKGVIKPSSSP
jgi:hypothetical protein